MSSIYPTFGTSLEEESLVINKKSSAVTIAAQTSSFSAKKLKVLLVAIVFVGINGIFDTRKFLFPVLVIAERWDLEDIPGGDFL